MGRMVCVDAIMLEDFDIKNMSAWFMCSKVGVNVSQIYTQIAKYSGNPKRENELDILVKAISSYETGEYEADPRYVLMEINEAKICFKDNMKKLPKTTFKKVNG